MGFVIALRNGQFVYPELASVGIEKALPGGSWKGIGYFQALFTRRLADLEVRGPLSP